MKKSKMYATAVVAIVALLAWGAFLLYGARQSENEADILCSKLEVHERQDFVGIIADGAFFSHHENLAYIGDLVSFELAVAYNPLTTEIFDERLLQFNTSPFVRFASGPVRTIAYEGCTVKRVKFDLRVLNVEVGTRNTFGFFNDDGFARVPEVPYSVNGVRRDASVSYDGLFVAPLTQGILALPSDFPLVFLKENTPTESESISLALIWLGSLLLGSFLVFATLLLRHRRRSSSSLEESPDVLTTLFPDLYANLNPEKDLTKTYFALSVYIDCLGADELVRVLKSMRERALVVFSDTTRDNQFTEVLGWIQTSMVSIRPELEDRREVLMAKRGET